MTINEAYNIISQSVKSLAASGVIDTEFDTEMSTVLLGTGAALDSIGLITLLSDVEERVSDVSGRELYLVLGDIHDFNEDKQNLTVETLAGYIEKITA